MQPDPAKFLRFNRWLLPGMEDHSTFNLTIDIIEGLNQPWTYSEWILTSKPGLFGLINGYANPTGVGLIITLIVMVLATMWRRGKHIQASFFYSFSLKIIIF